METAYKTTYFNRHESMSSETRSEIMYLISDLMIIENCNPRNVINMLYGAFDGVNYCDHIKNDILIHQLQEGGNTGLINQIFKVVETISEYPSTDEPNLNQF